MRALLLGILSSFFFAFTFILNRAMELGGGSWLWSASLRYFFMVPLLLLLVLFRSSLAPLRREMLAQPLTWLLWSFVGFGIFYASITYAAAYSPAWLVAGTWQVTIIAGALLPPLFGRKIFFKGLLMSLVILLGVLLMQIDEAEGLTLRQVLSGFLPVLFAAFAYPLGNRKMMEACGGRLDAYQRTLGMTLASLPLWIAFAVYAGFTVGAPSGSQVLQSLLVALVSGVVATVLFFAATDLARNNVQQLATVEATQSLEVIFALLGEMVLLSAALPSLGAWVGMALVILGMALHSWVSNAQPVPTQKGTSV